MNGNPEQATRDSVPRGRPRRQPSRRNLELYFELVCEGRRQTDVAMRFRVSQPRVAQICADVAGWVDEMLGGRAGEGSQAAPPEILEEPARFHLAIALRRIQIEAAYGRYLNYFGGAKGAAGYGHLLEAMEAGVLPAAAAVSLPPPQFIKDAVRMAGELDALASLARRGPFAELPQVLRAAREQLSAAPASSTAI